MTPQEAAQIAARGRRLLRANRITHHDYAILDALLWSGRRPGSDTATVPYSSIMRLAHVCRATVAGAVAKLARLGVFRIIKRKLLVLWHNGGRQWKQLASSYKFHCQSAGQTEYREIVRIVEVAAPPAAQSAAKDALEMVRERRQMALGLA